MARQEIDCSQTGWIADLEQHVQTGEEVDLINFDYSLHGSFAKLVADKYHFEFRQGRDAALKEAHVRRQW